MSIITVGNLVPAVLICKHRSVDRIEFAFTRPRFAALIGAALLTVTGLVATGVMAGIQIGAESTPAAPGIVFRTAAPPIEQPTQLPAPQPTEMPRPEERPFVLQAGSFLSDSEARRLASILTGKAYPVQVINVKDAAERTWWVVRVGPYAQREEALHAADELKLRGATIHRTRPND